MKLDDTDVLILKMLDGQDEMVDGKHKPRLSLNEILHAIPGIRSIATIHARVTKLEEAGFISQPARKMPRSRTITTAGQEELKRQLYEPEFRGTSHFSQ